MANVCTLISPVVTVDLRHSHDGNRRHSEVSQLRRPTKSQNCGFRVRTYAVSFMTMAVLCLGSLARAVPPVLPQFVAAQSVVPTGDLSYPYRCAVDASGNVYISNTQGNDILKETLTNGVYTESV